MNAHNLTAGGLDYAPCRYGTSRVQFRGPQKRLRGDYVAFLGSTETFGLFIETPYPDLIEQASSISCVNLGSQKAGIDSFLSAPCLVDICSMAKATVIEVMGAQNMSNRFFTVDPRRNNKFLRASKRLKEIYDTVDFSTIGTTDHLLSVLARTAPEKLYLVREEMQNAWVARMRSLIAAIEGPVILLWAAAHAPFCAKSGGTVCREPLFIDRAMLTAAMEGAEHLVEVVVGRDEVAAGLKQMRFGPSDGQAAVEMLGPVAHGRIRDALMPVLTELVAPRRLPQFLEEPGGANIFAEQAKD